ncbi:Inactive serine/threonine-protein kinase plk5 [Mortierella sp. AD031]|nr:Inactive serine/threonine-protein kinase plk5 [Mortierella sp. AD031]KAG0215709.1 Inactive serine/threonine-protein kinase plk5 [Mortierella sp. NVP41]
MNHQGITNNLFHHNNNQPGTPSPVVLHMMRHCLEELAAPRLRPTERASVTARLQRLHHTKKSLPRPPTTSKALLEADKTTFVNMRGNQEYEEQIVLGEGAFGKMARVIRKSDKLVFALKTMHPALMKMAKKEADLMIATKKAKGVVELVAAFEHNNQPCLFLEYCPLGDFEELLTMRGKMEGLEVRYYGNQLVAAIAAIHQAGVLHRDLKPCNILVCRGFHLKVADFGLSERTGAAGQDKIICGTPGFIAPEVLRGEEHSTAMDIWSLGVIVYYMFTKKLVGSLTRTEMNQSLKTPRAKLFIKSMLKPSPKGRATAKGLAKDEFLIRGYCPRTLDFTAFFQEPPSRAAVVKKSLTHAVGHVVKAMISISDAMINFAEPAAAAKDGTPGKMIGAYPEAITNPKIKRARPSASFANSADNIKKVKKANGKQAQGKRAHGKQAKTQAARRH